MYRCVHNLRENRNLKQRQAAEKLPNKDQLILVYCRSGNRSKTASEALEKLGYTYIREFGGIKDWPYQTESIK